MYKKTEYLLKLERLEYDLESKKMELEGLKKEYEDMRSRIKYYVIPFVIIILFYIFAISVYMTDGYYGFAFLIVMGPIMGGLMLIYTFFMFRYIWKVYLHGNSKRAISLSDRFSKRSITVEIERCQIEIYNLEIRIENVKNKIKEYT